MRKIKKERPEKWLPNAPEPHYYIDNTGEVRKDISLSFAVIKKAYFMGIFQTKEEAEARRDAIRQFCETLN